MTYFRKSFALAALAFAALLAFAASATVEESKPHVRQERWMPGPQYCTWGNPVASQCFANMTCGLGYACDRTMNRCCLPSATVGSTIRPTVPTVRPSSLCPDRSTPWTSCDSSGRCTGSLICATGNLCCRNNSINNPTVVTPAPLTNYCLIITLNGLAAGSAANELTNADKDKVPYILTQRIVINDLNRVAVTRPLYPNYTPKFCKFEAVDPATALTATDVNVFVSLAVKGAKTDTVVENEVGNAVAALNPLAFTPYAAGDMFLVGQHLCTSCV